MQAKLSPYASITPELAASGLLIPIKHAAENTDCCEGTLKNNAKARRLRAYQAGFGAPVMVLLAEVEEFLKSRPDIASKYQPKTSLEISATVLPTTSAKAETCGDFPFPKVEGDCGEDSHISIMLRSLVRTTPSERALVAQVLLEVASQINETVPAESGNQP